MSNPQDPYGHPGQPPSGPPPGGWQQQPPGPPQQPGWGAQGQWGGPPTGPPSKSNLPLILGIVAVVVILAGGAFLVLSSDDDGAITVAPDDLTTEDLEGLLLQSDDVPDGFTETYRGEKIDTSDELEGFPADCEAAMEELEANSGDEDRDDRVTVEFSREDEAEITHTVAPVREEHPSPDDFLESFQEHCSEPFEAANPEGMTFGMQLESEAVSGLGEDAFALVTALEHDMFRSTVEVYGLYVFQDGIVSTTTVSGGFDLEQSTPADMVPTPFDEDLARELSELSLGRIEQNMG